MNTMYRMLHQKFVSPSVVPGKKIAIVKKQSISRGSMIRKTVKLASITCAMSIFLAACSTPKSPYVNQPVEKPSLEKALHEGIDSMRWGSDSDRLGPRTREPVLEKALFKEVPVNVACYVKGADNGTIHQLFDKNPKLTIYCFKDDHLFAAFKLFKGYTSFYTLRPDKATPPVIEMQNHDKWVTWISGDGDNRDEIDFNNVYYYQADAGFAMIMNDTIYRDNLDNHEQTAYSQHKSKLHIIYSMVDLQDMMSNDPVPEVPKRVITKKKHYKKPVTSGSKPASDTPASSVIPENPGNVGKLVIPVPASTPTITNPNGNQL